MVPTLRALTALDVTADLARIATPIWFVNGLRDHIRIEEQLLLAGTPAATLVVVPAAGHLVALDRPERFADLVSRRCREVDVLAERALPGESWAGVTPHVSHQSQL